MVPGTCWGKLLCESTGRTQTMFDTLRFADRLKNSGFENRQAEGMARALGDEVGKLTERLVTKSHLTTEIGALRSDFTALDSRLGTKFNALSNEFHGLSARFDALSAKVDALNMQVKFIFALLAVLLALGLIDTVPGMLS